MYNCACVVESVSYHDYLRLCTIVYILQYVVSEIFTCKVCVGKHVCFHKRIHVKSFHNKQTMYIATLAAACLYYNSGTPLNWTPEMRTLGQSQMIQERFRSIPLYC